MDDLFRALAIVIMGAITLALWFRLLVRPPGPHEYEDPDVAADPGPRVELPVARLRSERDARRDA